MRADTIVEVSEELARARDKFKPMVGPHEGWAVIREEVDELWDEVKQSHQDSQRMRKEARQVAAMAIRFMEDVCGEQTCFRLKEQAIREESHDPAGRLPEVRT